MRYSLPHTGDRHPVLRLLRTEGPVPIVLPKRCRRRCRAFRLRRGRWRSGRCCRKRRRELIEKGNQAEADFVAEDIIDKVGGVGDVALADGIEILEDILTADTEQGADNVAVAGTDAREAVDACTTEEVHQEGLDGIVTMMGDTDGLGPDVLTQLVEIAVAEFAGRHFNAYLM